MRWKYLKTPHFCLHSFDAGKPKVECIIIYFLSHAAKGTGSGKLFKFESRLPRNDNKWVTGLNRHLLGDTAMTESSFRFSWQAARSQECYMTSDRWLHRLISCFDGAARVEKTGEHRCVCLLSVKKPWVIAFVHCEFTVPDKPLRSACNFISFAFSFVFFVNNESKCKPLKDLRGRSPKFKLF